MKNLIEAIKANKDVIIKRTVLVIGTTAGLILTSAFVQSGKEVVKDIELDDTEPTDTPE